MLNINQPTPSTVLPLNDLTYITLGVVQDFIGPTIEPLSLAVVKKDSLISSQFIAANGSIFILQNGEYEINANFLGAIGDSVGDSPPTINENSRTGANWYIRINSLVFPDFTYRSYHRLDAVDAMTVSAHIPSINLIGGQEITIAASVYEGAARLSALASTSLSVRRIG